MKRLVTFLATLACIGLMAAPASAVHLTDNDKTALKDMIAESWDFYGHARMQTFWTSSDQESPNNSYADDVTYLEHDLSSVNRFGANVDHGKIGGKVEIEANAAHSGGQSVNTRLFYGTLDIGPGQLLAGQNWTPFTLSNIYSGQTFPDDRIMLGYSGYDHRQPQLAYTIDGLTLALVRPHGSFEGGPGSLQGNSTTNIPQVQVSYATNVSGIGVHAAGVYQSYTLAEGNDPGEGDRLTSYAVSTNVRLGGVLPGPLYSNFGGYYGQNVGNMGFLVGGQSLAMTGTSHAKVNNTTGDVDEDATTYGILAVLGTEVNNVGLEAGFGYAVNDRDDFATEDNSMGGYLQADIAIAEDHNAFIVPEVGFTDNMDSAQDTDQGTDMYAGMKTEIRF